MSWVIIQRSSFVIKGICIERKKIVSTRFSVIWEYKIHKGDFKEITSTVQGIIRNLLDKFERSVQKV